MVWLHDGGKSLRIYVTILTEYQCVTDKRMDRKILQQYSLCYAYIT